MLTADAASKHGHEFSDYQAPQWLVARRSPFRVLPYATKQRTPQRSLSLRGTMGELKEVPEESDDMERAVHREMSIRDLRIPGSFIDHPPSPELPPPDPVPEAPSETEPFPEMEPLTTVESHSEQSDRRSHRPKTRYHLAHPPPSTLPLRKQLGNRSLLQFHQQSDSGFHKPVFEVIPISRLGSITTVGGRLRRFVMGKANFAAEDVAVVHVGNYGAVGMLESFDIPESRNVLGVISRPQPAANKTEGVQILLENAMWFGHARGRGVYDLSTGENDEQHARWYIPKAKKRQSADGWVDGKLYFAPILPNTKRHPTVAALSRSCLDIYESYSAYVDPEPQPGPAEVPDRVGELDFATPIPTDEMLRRLIIISSLWVMACEGWTHNFNFAPISSPAQSRSLPPGPSRTPSQSKPADLAMQRIAKEAILEDDSSMTSLDSKQPPSGPSPSKAVLGSDSKPDKPRPTKLTKEPPRALTPASDLPNAGTEVNPPQKDARPETPEGQSSTVPSLISEPTAQFRHLLALEKTRSGSPIHLPLSRLRVGRRATPEPTEGKIHSRRFSLGWNLRLHKSRASKSTSTTMSAFEDQTSTDDNLTPVSGLSKAPSVEFGALTPVNVDGASLNLQDTPTATAASEQSLGESEAATAVHISADSTVHGDVESVPGEPDAEPGWDDSDSSSKVDAPYWKEFDRLQERAFWQRAEASNATTGPGSGLESVEGAPEVAADEADASHDQGRGWFSAVRLSVSRRRWSMSGT